MMTSYQYDDIRSMDQCITCKIIVERTINNQCMDCWDWDIDQEQGETIITEEQPDDNPF